MGQGEEKVKESGKGNLLQKGCLSQDTDTVRIAYRCKRGKKETQQRNDSEQRVSRSVRGEGGWPGQSLKDLPTPLQI